MASPYGNPSYPVLPNAGPGYAPYPGYPPPGQDQPQVAFGGYGQAPPPGYQYPPAPIPVAPHNMPPPVTHQPQFGGGDMGAFYDIQRGGFGHTVPVNVPPGLEYLTQVDALYVKQKVEMLEAICGCETNNKYKIKNNRGEVIYNAKEDTDCCTRNCCGTLRPFDLKIKDGNDQEVIHLTRPLACNSCCFPCCLQSIEIFAPPGQLAGTVEQEWSICIPKFVIKNSSGDVVLRIEGPCCTYSFCGDVEFQILSQDGTSKVGKISKKWSGLLREAFTDADNFGINFPMDLDVRMKAVMMGACFLIDFMFFEKSQNQESDGIGMM